MGRGRQEVMLRVCDKFFWQRSRIRHNSGLSHRLKSGNLRYAKDGGHTARNHGTTRNTRNDVNAGMVVSVLLAFDFFAWREDFLRGELRTKPVRGTLISAHNR